MKNSNNYLKPPVFSCKNYLENNLPTISEWQLSVWNANEKPKQMMAPIKNALKINFSCNWISKDGRVRKYMATPMNITQPRRCVQMLPVSVWILKMDLKQALKDGKGGLCPLCRKSLSCNQDGRCLKWHTFHEATNENLIY